MEDNWVGHWTWALWMPSMHSSLFNYLPVSSWLLLTEDWWGLERELNRLECVLFMPEAQIDSQQHMVLWAWQGMTSSPFAFALPGVVQKKRYLAPEPAEITYSFINWSCVSYLDFVLRNCPWATVHTTFTPIVLESWSELRILILSGQGTLIFKIFTSRTFSETTEYRGSVQVGEPWPSDQFVFGLFCTE